MLKKTWWIVFIVLILDHSSKLWVKTNMMLNQEYVIFDWFRIHFTENNGMAFGIELFDKLFLTLFRMVLIVALIWLVQKLHQNKAHQSVKLAFSMILGGAIGNVIDALVYGPLFTHSSRQVAEFTTTEGSTSMFYGQVVDMFYFPL
ncbi:MAG: signal peptidase II, partial [Flavobacteriales bacterium]